MFNYEKRDYYSVNANVSMSPLRERSVMAHSSMEPTKSEINGEIRNEELLVVPPDDDRPGTIDPSLHQGDTTFEERMPNFIPAVKYEDIYYPRTDKRMIRGNQYTY